MSENREIAVRGGGVAEIEHLAIESIRPNPEQPRSVFQNTSALAESIAEHGVIEPIMVRPLEGGYQIVHGERRWRAATEAGLDRIPAIVCDVDDREAYELSLIENIHREDLSPVEEARSFERMIDDGCTQKRIAHIIGKDRSYVAQKMRLLRLPDFLTHYVAHGLLSENHVRQAMRLKDMYVYEELALPVGDWEVEPSDCVSGPEDAGMLLNDLRPASRPCWLAREDEHPEIISAVEEFLRECVAKHTIPQWQITAFFYLSAAVRLDLSVARLNNALEKWKDGIYSQLIADAWPRPGGNTAALARELDTGMPKAARAERMVKALYPFMVRGDLRHAGMPEGREDARDNYPELYEKAFWHVVEKGGVACPSVIQYPSTPSERETSRHVRALNMPKDG